MTAKQRIPTKITIERIYDLLEIDGGWWAYENIGERLGLKRETVRRAVRMHRDRFDFKPHPNDPNEASHVVRAKPS